MRQVLLAGSRCNGNTAVQISALFDFIYKGNITMSKKIILTGGGTAGHVTPNLALLPRLRAEGYEIHYIGTAEGIEKSLVGDLEGVTYHTISAGKLRRYFSLKNLTDPFKVVGGIFQAKRIINKVKPDVVFSKGGFVSVPM